MTTFLLVSGPGSALDRAHLHAVDQLLLEDEEDDGEFVPELDEPDELGELYVLG